MSTVNAAPTRAPGTTTDSPFTGTGALLRLNLRLDRLRLIIWTLAVGLGVWGSVISLQATYPTTESLRARAALLDNPATIMMTGPAFAQDNYTFGAMLANELSLYVLLAAAIMSVLLAVRHTRAEEEAGRLELVRSRPVGRFAPATASVLLAGIANLLVDVVTTIGLLATGMATPDSLTFGLATALTGLVFAAIATLFAQVTENTRTATSMSMAAVAIAYLVRGLGDVIDRQGSWLSWFSPFAWAQQTKLYVDLRWWPLAVWAGVAVAIYALAMLLARRRDLGAGLRPSTGGRATAARTLLSPAGLAERLLRGSLIVWSIGAFFFAVAMGALAMELDDLLDSNPALKDWLAVEGTDLTAQFAGIILSFVLIAPLIIAVSGVLRLKPEDETGRTEQMIVSGSSRARYLGGWLLTVLVHLVVLTLICGFGVGLGVTIGTGEGRWIADLTLAAAVHLPAIALIAALAVALYGVLPRLTGLAWLLVVWVALVLFLGELLDLPDWSRDISPFTHTALYPADAIDPVPLLVMGGLAVVLVIVGVLGFGRRQIASR